MVPGLWRWGFPLVVVVVVVVQVHVYIRELLGKGEASKQTKPTTVTSPLLFLIYHPSHRF